MPIVTNQNSTLDLLQGHLARYRELTLHGLLTAIPDREPRRYLYDPLVSHLSRMGKGLRPALCIVTCRACGGAEEDALQSAVALEMLHNAFLVHDDVEDESEYRRSLPTMCSEHGVPIAVNAGDALNALSLKLVRDNMSRLGPDTTWHILQEFEHLMLQSLEGQAMELGWIRDNRTDILPDDYLAMALKKTCWYSFIHPCRIGALIAQRNNTDLDRFNRFGYFMGIAFQVQDDILNLVGDSLKYGKEIGGDLWEGKRTLMLIHLLQNCQAGEGERLRGFLSLRRNERKGSEVQWILDRMHHYASIDYARSVAKQFVEATLHEFDRAYGSLPESEDKAFIALLVRYMIDRNL